LVALIKIFFEKSKQLLILILVTQATVPGRTLISTLLKCRICHFLFLEKEESNSAGWQRGDENSERNAPPVPFNVPLLNITATVPSAFVFHACSLG
jgi:hypothetical protein